MCNLLGCFGCLTLLGFRDKVTQKLVYFPPEPTYEIEGEGDEQKIYMLDDKGRKCDPRLLKCTTLTTRKGQQIATVLVACRGANTTMLYSHGNAADLGLLRDHIIDLARHLKVNILAYDYSGYGRSTGKPSPSNTYADCEAAFEHVLSEFPQHKIILYGQSLGSGVSIHLGNKYPDKVHGIVIHSGIMSGLRVIRPREGANSLWFDIYPNVDTASQVEAPIFVIHGTADEDVPVEHGIGIVEQAKHCYDPWFIDGAGHNNIESCWRTSLIERLRNFVLDIQNGSALAKCRATGEMSDHSPRGNKYIVPKSSISSSSSPSKRSTTTPRNNNEMRALTHDQHMDSEGPTDTDQVTMRVESGVPRTSRGSRPTNKDYHAFATENSSSEEREKL